jgi:hypothetical protein
MDSGSSPMAAGTAEPMGELVELPANLRQAFRAELARAFHSPYETPIVVLVNGLLTTLAWFLIPNSGLFTLHGALAFPIVLASWMYSDVPATNVYGPDARRVLAALDEPKALFRLLVAKSAVLWLLVVPICSTIALVLGAKEGRPVSTGFTIFWVAIAPLGALGLCSWVGVRFPYHPLPLKVRVGEARPLPPDDRPLDLAGGVPLRGFSLARSPGCVAERLDLGAVLRAGRAPAHPGPRFRARGDRRPRGCRVRVVLRAAVRGPPVVTTPCSAGGLSG